VGYTLEGEHCRDIWICIPGSSPDAGSVALGGKLGMLPQFNRKVMTSPRYHDYSPHEGRRT
jgi:hypothetical protein